MVKSVLAMSSPPPAVESVGAEPPDQMTELGHVAVRLPPSCFKRRVK